MSLRGPEDQNSATRGTKALTKLRTSIVMVVLDFMVVNSELSGCRYPSVYLSNFICVIDFKGDNLCSIIQKYRPQTTELSVIFSCVESTEVFQDVENWAVKRFGR